jgi:hypothetical protein
MRKLDAMCHIYSCQLQIFSPLLEHLQQPRYKAHALKKSPVYRARRRNRPSSSRGIRGGAAIFFGRTAVCPIRGTKCEVSATARDISADAREYTTAEIPPAPSIPPPPAPPPHNSAAAGRFRRQPCCSSSPRRRSDSPAPPPGAVASRRRPAPLPRDAAGGSPHLLLQTPRRRRHVVESTVNMAQPRRSSVCSQGMRLRRPPSFSQFFCCY